MIVYKATNKVNGKSYIGKTIRTLEERKKQHLLDSKGKPSFHFHRALKKWGEEMFEWEVLFVGLSEEELFEKEILFVEHYNTYKEGYNQTRGGQGQSGWVPSKETRRKWSEQRKGNNQYIRGYVHPNSIFSKNELTPEEIKQKREETNKKISYALKGRVPWNKGKKTGGPSEETTGKIQESRRRSGYVHVITVYLESGSLYKEFKSQSECAEEMGLCKKTVRKYVKSGKPFKGFIFKRQ